MPFFLLTFKEEVYLLYQGVEFQEIYSYIVQRKVKYVGHSYERLCSNNEKI